MKNKTFLDKIRKIIKYIKNIFKKNQLNDITKENYIIAGNGLGNGKNLVRNLANIIIHSQKTVN